MTRRFVLSGLFITGLLGHGAEAFAAAGSFAPTGNLNIARSCQTATLLANGEVLVAGGWVLMVYMLHSPAPSCISK